MFVLFVFHIPGIGTESRTEVVERCKACEVNVQPLAIGSHGEIDDRSLRGIKCMAVSASGNGFWKDKATALTRHILTALTLNLFRAKATMLIRVMREVYPNQFFSFSPETGLIDTVFAQSKINIATTALNEPYLLLRLPPMHLQNEYIP